jgi:hypothetical protein
MLGRWLSASVVASVVVAGMAVAARADDAPALSDQVIERLATGLARIAEGASPRPVAYFSAEPTAQVKAYLDGQGVEVAVLGSGGMPAFPAPIAAPAPPPPAGMAPAPPGVGSGGPYGLMGMRVPETKKLFEDFLVGVREIAKGLPGAGPLVVEGFTVDLPGGSILFRMKEPGP